MDGNKICTKCKVIKSLEEFYTFPYSKGRVYFR